MANGKFRNYVKTTAKNTVDGEPGSIFWLFKMMYRAFMRMVQAVNDWLVIRNVTRNRDDDEFGDDDTDTDVDTDDGSEDRN